VETAKGGGSTPNIIKIDHGCQFTSAKFVGRLRAEGIKNSWSVRKLCQNNKLVERL